VQVRKGDTLSRLAQRYKLSIQQIAAWNKLSIRSSLKAGQQIVLMAPSKASQVMQKSRKAVKPHSKVKRRRT
jgi:membrane-bound lytic murein transglycosylase D